MSPKKDHNRFEMDLHEAIQLVLDTVELRKKGIQHNLLYLIGDPGSGKTMMIGEMTKDAGGGFVAYSPALERLEKFGGIPDLFWKENGDAHKELRTVWSIPQMITEINECADAHPFVVVLLDDWHLCIDELQQIGFELFTYYSLNGHRVRDNVVFVLAGNETSAAGAKVQLSAIRNRSTVVYTTPNLEHWLNNYAMPTGIHPVGVSFFRNKSNSWCFQEEESTSEQFGSPRSWTSAFRMIKEIEDNPKNRSSNYIHSCIQAVIQGSVSSKATEKFLMHYDIFSKIDIDKIFNSQDIKIPEDNTERFCLSSAINYEYFNRFVTLNQKQKVEDLYEVSKFYSNTLEKFNKKFPEISIMMIQELGNMTLGAKERPRTGNSILQHLVSNQLLSKELLSEISNVQKVLMGNDKK